MNINDYFKKARVSDENTLIEHLQKFQSLPVFTSDVDVLALDISKIEPQYLQTLLNFILTANKVRIDNDEKIIITTQLLKFYPHWGKINKLLTK